MCAGERNIEIRACRTNQLLPYEYYIPLPWRGMESRCSLFQRRNTVVLASQSYGQRD